MIFQDRFFNPNRDCSTEYSSSSSRCANNEGYFSATSSLLPSDFSLFSVEEKNSQKLNRRFNFFFKKTLPRRFSWRIVEIRRVEIYTTKKKITSEKRINSQAKTTNSTMKKNFNSTTNIKKITHALVIIKLFTHSSRMCANEIMNSVETAQ